MVSIHDLDTQLAQARLLPPGQRERAVKRLLKAYRKHTGQTGRYTGDGKQRDELVIYGDVAGKKE